MLGRYSASLIALRKLIATVNGCCMHASAHPHPVGRDAEVRARLQLSRASKCVGDGANGRRIKSRRMHCMHYFRNLEQRTGEPVCRAYVQCVPDFPRNPIWLTIFPGHVFSLVFLILFFVLLSWLSWLAVCFYLINSKLHKIHTVSDKWVKWQSYRIQL